MYTRNAIIVSLPMCKKKFKIKNYKTLQYKTCDLKTLQKAGETQGCGPGKKAGR